MIRCRRRACALVLAVAWLAPACGGSEPKAPPAPPPGRGRDLHSATVATEAHQPEPAKAPAAPSVADQVAQAQARLRNADPNPKSPAEGTGAASDGVDGAGTAAKPESKPDLPGHLKTAMAGAPTCLGPRTTEGAQKQLNIAVATYAMATGSVSRAEVSGAGLSPDELACLKRMAESVRFPSPVEGAPKRISTTVTLELQPPKSAEPAAQ